MRRLLIISFSNITQDARVLKQVDEFSSDWEVSTCSYGPKPDGSTHHYTIPDEAIHWAYDRKDLILRRYERAYWTNAAVASAKGLLEGGTWDVVLADDLDTVPLALSLDPAFGVHADLHEYAPREKEDLLRWRVFVGPFRRWLCREYLPGCASVTTVGAALAREYEREFGVEVGVVMNATPYADLPVNPVSRPIRVVHSGAGRKGRALEVMLEAATRTGADITLDMYLTPNDPGYVQQLRERFGDHPKININDPVPYTELIATLNRYDVGVFVLPPRTFSYRWALPNKLFDFVQARLGIIIGPSPEMAAIVKEHRLGAVAGGFEARHLVEAFDRLTPGAVDSWKRNSSRVALELSAAPQNARWREAVEAIAVNGPRHGKTQPEALPVEIVIACHSPERRIDRAVRSVVVDNGDVASATVVCHNVDRDVIAERVPEGIRGRVKFIELQDGVSSPTGPFMHGLGQATAPWAGIMGSDDFYEPGAIAAMLELAEGRDAVMPRLRHDSGSAVRTPPARPGPRAVQDAVRDRLFYRSAPLGLLRRGALEEYGLALDAGFKVGGDLRMSTLLWSLGSVAVQRRGPRYVVGSDAADRVTMSLPPIAEEMRHVEAVWGEACQSRLTDAQRQALATKYLRIHIFGAAYYRGAEGAWLPGDREALARAASRVLEAAPAAAEPLSRADRDLLDAILDLSVPDAEVGALAESRRRFGRPNTLIPRSARYLLHREAPPRFMAASALVR
ncbi:hypothetical protein JD276_01360 [Leucobacter sp. CSA1]|uniref:Glycosyltransferase 2-like domain-containing protein n=1 Tax=Leucobacter chromiisoli TaxID=2796471 RepID=A0A934Q5C5_9MICO|nr:glycosyltransferase [Leucobacter chromiisoli]MBK0417685.1 hypothetical protein [Leucobacter chromiisoli]